MNQHSKVKPLQAHPAAEAYRLMSDDELSELAESIKANGLRDPITVGIIGEDRWIVDGRNRERACEAAGVAPEYEEIEFADEAELRAFVADRSERRNITKGQKAMAYAMLFPEGKRTGRGNKVSKSLADFSHTLLSQARTVLATLPEYGPKVRDGFPLEEAYEIAMKAKRAPETDEALRLKLGAEAPDLFALVKDGKMKVTEAIAALEERHRQELDAKKVATGNLLRIVNSLSPRGASVEQASTVMFGKVDEKLWPADALPFNAETIKGCIDVLTAFYAERFGP